MLSSAREQHNSTDSRPVRDFEEHPLENTSECGINALETTREELVKKLLTFHNDPSCRKKLAEEIYEAFFLYRWSQGVEHGIEPPDEKFNKIYASLNNAQAALRTTHSEIACKIDNYKDTVLIEHQPLGIKDKDLEELIKKFQQEKQSKLASVQLQQWLQSHQVKNYYYKESAKKLLKDIEKVNQQEAKIIKYCSIEKCFVHFLKRFAESKLQLGIQTALLYAEASNLSLFIWKSNPDNLNNLACTYVNKGGEGNKRLDILDMGSYKHFNKLVLKLDIVNDEESISEEHVISKSKDTLSFNGSISDLTDLSDSNKEEAKLDSDLFNENYSFLSVTRNREIEAVRGIQSDREEVQRFQRLINEKQNLITAQNYQDLRLLAITIHRCLKLQNTRNKSILIDEINSLTLRLNDIYDNYDNEENEEFQNKIKDSQLKFENYYFVFAAHQECLNDLNEDIAWGQDSHIEFSYQQRLYGFFERTLHKIVISAPTDEQTYTRYFESWLASLPLLKIEQVKESSQLITNELFKTRRLGLGGYHEILLKRLIEEAETNAHAYLALNILLAAKPVQEFIQQCNTIEHHFISSLNSRTLRRQDPYEHFELFAKLFRKAFGQDENRLANILNEIKFSTSHELACALYRVFVINSADDLTAKVFFKALIKSLKLTHFQNPIVVTDTEKEITIRHLNKLLSHESGISDIVSKLIKYEKKHFPHGEFPVHSLLTPAFLYLSQYKYGLSDPFTWYRILFYLGCNVSFLEQQALCLNIKKVDEKALLTRLSISLEDVYRYYIKNSVYKTEFIEVYKQIINRIVDAIRLTVGKSIPTSINRLQIIIDHCLGVRKDYLHLIFSYQDKMLGKYDNGLKAVQEIFAETMQGDQPDKWQTKDISEKIYFIYCFAKFPIEEYHKWFISANPQHNDYARQKLPKKFADIQQLQDQLDKNKYLPELGFKVIQNSQLTAIKCVIEPPHDAKHVFVKIGTGQGKSLVIALTALYYALQSDKKIYVFTVYEHLAKRDYERFKPLFDNYKIKTELVKRPGVIANDVKIIYAELSTYCKALYDQIERKAHNKNEVEDTFNFLEPGIVLLDEFDSIILDSHLFGNTVYEQQDFFQLGKLTEHHLQTYENFKTVLSEKIDMGNFFQALGKHKLDGWGINWIDQGSWQQGYEERNALGILKSYVGGDFYELTKKGRFLIKMMNFNVLVFLKNAERVLGFSGSIDNAGIAQFGKLFPDYVYFELPPFFGLHNAKDKKNHELYNNHDKPLSKKLWKLKIEASIMKAINDRQPILVFADTKKEAEWEDIKAHLQRLANESQRTLYIIKDEAHVTGDKLVMATRQNVITLASHIVGRGADFIVLPDVINDCDGLHVIITYLPNNNGVLDERMLTQMIGRTARMDNPGTHAIIVKESFPKGDKSPITINDAVQKYHDLLCAIYTVIKDLPYDKNLWRMWLLLNLFIHKSNDYPQVLSNLGTIEKAAQFIIDNIFKVKPAMVNNSSVLLGEQSISIDNPGVSSGYRISQALIQNGILSQRRNTANQNGGGRVRHHCNIL